MIPPSVSKIAAQRRAVRAHKERVLVSMKRFHTDGHMTARVAIGGRSYDVKESELTALQRGLTPDELALDPVPDE